MPTMRRKYPLDVEVHGYIAMGLNNLPQQQISNENKVTNHRTISIPKLQNPTGSIGAQQLFNY